MTNLAMSYQSLHIREGLTKIHRTANTNHLTNMILPSLPLSFQFTALLTDHYSGFFDGEDLNMNGLGLLAGVFMSKDLPSSRLASESWHIHGEGLPSCCLKSNKAGTVDDVRVDFETGGRGKSNFGAVEGGDGSETAWKDL